MIQTSCAICGSLDNYKVLYKSNFSGKDLNIDVFSARRLPDGSHYQIVKCNKDGLVRSNPILESSKISNLYKESKFTYEDETENLTTTYIESLLPVLDKISKNDNVLEVGCGNGFILSKLYDLGYKNCFGVEPSREAVEKAEYKVKRNIIVDILKPGIYKSRKFRLIFLFQTLDHIPNPNEFLEDCCKLIEHGGYFLAFNHNIDSFWSKLLKEKSPIIDIEHTYLYDPKTIKILFEKYKFKVLDIYSPTSTISLKHLLWLLPLPKPIKNLLFKISVSGINLKVKLGNLCILAQKI